MRIYISVCFEPHQMYTSSKTSFSSEILLGEVANIFITVIGPMMNRLVGH